MTIVNFNTGTQFKVKETPEEIGTLIKEAAQKA